jgi:hypothetical protein
VVPSLSTGSPFLASFTLFIVVYTRQHHQDRKDPDDKKHKHQNNRFLAAHTVILCPGGHWDPCVSKGCGSCRGGKDSAGAPSARLVWYGGADGERHGLLSVPLALSAFQGRQPRATPGSCRPT